MNPQANNDTGHNEEPLIILRYNGWIWIRIFGHAFITFCFGGIAFQLTGPIESDLKLTVAKITFVASLFLCGYLSADLVLTRNVRLYRDRAVKTYWIFGSIVFPLSDCNIGYNYYAPGLLPGKMLCIAPRKTKRFSNPFRKYITFDCGLTNRKDIRRLKEVLQSLGINAERTYD